MCPLVILARFERRGRRKMRPFSSAENLHHCLIRRRDVCFHVNAWGSFIFYDMATAPRNLGDFSIQPPARQSDREADIWRAGGPRLCKNSPWQGCNIAPIYGDPSQKTFPLSSYCSRIIYLSNAQHFPCFPKTFQKHTNVPIKSREKN